MEAVGAVVGIIDVTLRATSKLWSLSQAWKDAPADMYRLQDDLMRTQRFFSETREGIAALYRANNQNLIASESHASWRELERLLDEGTEVVCRIEKFIDSLSTEAGAGDAKALGRSRRVMWMTSAKKLGRWRGELRDIISNVCRLLIAQNISVSAATQISVERSSYQIMSHVDPRTQSPLRPGKSIFGKRPLGCQPNCACCCHSATRMSCRLVAFHMLIGSIRVWYRKQSNQRCTSADCQGTSASQDIRVDYRLPDWLTRATLSMLFSSNVNGNPEAVLRVVNILPETAVHPGSIFGMILSKDNEGIKDLIRRRECSIHDCVGQVVLSPLRLAARLNRYDIVRTLLMAGADPHQTEGASFTMSVASIIVDRFIQGRPKDLEACSQFPIYTYLEDFEFTPLHKLVMTGSHQDLAEALSKPMYLADINRRTLNGRTPLDVAAFRDDPDACELLIRAGADVNLDGCPTALYKACNLDHYHTVERLLTHGASVTAADKNGDCAILHHAQSAKTNFGARTMELLLRHGARVDATRRDGQQPLQQLGTWGDIVLDRINFLLDHGADVNHQDNLGETALLTAIKSFQEVAMALLLERGADPRLASYEGHTVLHKVGIHWNESILIDVLKMKPGLFRSVDVTAKDKSGKTALELFNGRKPPPNAKLRELFARFLTVACQACDDASSSDEDEFVDAQETAT